MRTGVTIGVCIAFPGLLLIIMVMAINMRPGEPPRAAEYTLDWGTRAIGTFVAAVAAMGLLLLALTGAPLDRTPPLALAFLAGLLLHGSHWSLALAFGAFGLAAILRDRFIRPPPRVTASDETAIR